MKIMITAEEFFRNKLKEQNPNLETLALSQVLITAEEGMQWAHEFKQLHLHDVVRQSEQLTCPRCKSTNILNPDRDNDAQCIECAFIWAG